MKHMKPAAQAAAMAMLCIVGSLPAMADNWVGQADYSAAQGSVGDEDIVGPFGRYDFGTGVVLVESTGYVGTPGSIGSTAFYNGYYQSFITRHEFNGVPASASNLDLTYELTVVASFSESATRVSSNLDLISVTGGVVNLYLDTTRDRDFNADSGFDDGDAILSGTILSGVGSAVYSGSTVSGFTDLTIQITSVDSNVFEPDNIIAGGSIFTLRLNNPLDASFINPITSVYGHSYDALSGDLKFAADGYIDLVAAPIPEMDQYALVLLGMGLVGLLARRRNTLA